MRNLDPLLKKIMVLVREEDPKASAFPTGPSAELVAQVLRAVARPAEVVDLSLLEFMIRRAAAVSALVGMVIIAIQIFAGETGGFYDALTQSASFFRVFLP